MNKKITRITLQNTLIGGTSGLLFGYWLTTLIPAIGSLNMALIITSFVVLFGVLVFNVSSRFLEE